MLHRKFFFINIYSLQRPTVLPHYLWSVAPQTTLWGGPLPRYELGTSDLEAGSLTTRPPHLLGEGFLNQWESNRVLENNLRGGYAVEGAWIVGNIGIEVGPELDEEEGLLGSLLVQLLQPLLLLGELVLDLPHVHRLQQQSQCHKISFNYTLVPVIGSCYDI